MYASLRLISVAERPCLPNRLFVRGGTILFFFPTMRGVRRFECLFRKIPATALIVGLEIIVLGAFEACRYETAVRLC